MNPYSDPTPIATTEEYVTALRRFRDSFKREKPFSDSNELKMLRSHYNAPKHAITATHLANLLDLKSFTVANLRYGTVARNITTHLEKTLPPLKSTKIPHWWRVLAYCNDDVALTDNSEIEWIMRPELCEAIDQLGWGGTRNSSAPRYTDLTPF